jgi:pimeloyl-ACP methyl ester carboxylesterase
VRYLDAGTGPVLLLIHGLGGAWQWWLEALPALIEQRRVVAVDLPGFGHSDALPPPADMATHAEVMAALCERLALEGVAVVGHSMGGLVSLELARTRPDLVDRVIMVNAGGVPMTEARLSLVIGFINASHKLLSREGVRRALARRPRARRLIARAATGRPDAFSGPLAAEVVPLMAAPGFVDAVLAAGRAVRDTEPEAVTQPVLLLWGDQDPIVPVHAAREMERRLQHPRLVLIEGSGHSPMVDQPALFVRHVLEFTEPR